jgi:hypothetical protein
MINISKRKLLHATGAGLLLSLIPLSMSYGTAAAIIICLLSIVCLVVADFIKPDARYANESRKRSLYVCPYEVEFDEGEVRVIYKGKPHESIAWSELKAVGVRIDDSFLPAPWWMLFVNPESGCMYPSEAKGGAEMLEEMQRRLAGFDNRAVIEAMVLMEGGKLVWSKENAEAQPIIPPDAAR